HTPSDMHSQQSYTSDACGARWVDSDPSRHVRRFFFQAEDGIRDDLVTGVQTCALPILTDELVHLERRLAGTAAVMGPDRVGLGLQPATHLLVLAPKVLVQEYGIEIDPHDAAVLCNGPELLVAQVARVVGQGPARRV